MAAGAVLWRRSSPAASSVCAREERSVSQPPTGRQMPPVPAWDESLSQRVEGVMADRAACEGWSKND